MARMDNLAYDFAAEAESFEFQESEWSSEGEVFSEAELLELAGGLLQVSNEAELDQFLGGLIRKAGSAIGSFIKSPVGRAVGGVLKTVAKKALPLAGGAIGGYFGGPMGAKIGSGLASMAGSALGLEAEAMEAEDREFEGAKQFVRMAGQAVRSTMANAATGDPALAAQQAVSGAASRYFPGLLARPENPVARPGPQQGPGGRWVRKGRNILLLNC